MEHASNTYVFSGMFSLRMTWREKGDVKWVKLCFIDGKSLLVFNLKERALNRRKKLLLLLILKTTCGVMLACSRSFPRDEVGR